MLRTKLGRFRAKLVELASMKAVYGARSWMMVPGAPPGTVTLKARYPGEN